MPDQEEIIQIELSEPQEAVLSTRQQLILEMSGQGGGKSQNIGYSSGMLLTQFPQAFGFIGANTYLQLSQSTLARVFSTWKLAYGFDEYDPKATPWGAYVVDKKPPPHFTRFLKLRDYAGTISFYNGHISFIGSLENYKAHEGKEFAWAHLDESKDTKEKALKDVIMGRLRQFGLWYDTFGEIHFEAAISAQEAARRGWKSWNPLYIHTSPSIDGAEWLIKMFQLDKFDKEIKRKCQARENDFFFREFENKAVCIYSAYHNRENLAPGYLANQEANLIEEDAILKLVDGYPFGKSGGEWLPYFRRDRHVKETTYIPGLPVHLTFDFNVVPYMTGIAIQVQNLLRFIDEIGTKYDGPGPGRTPIEVMRIRVYREYCLEEPFNTTEAVCQHFAADHDPRFTELFYYGDATGLHRIPGLGSLTNFKIVENELFAFLHNDSKQVKDPNVAPLKRRDLLNGIFYGKYPQIEIQIDPVCEKLITDCEQVKQGAAGKIKPKVLDTRTNKHYEKLGHPTDALECMVSELCKFLLSST